MNCAGPVSEKATQATTPAQVAVLTPRTEARAQQHIGIHRQEAPAGFEDDEPDHAEAGVGRRRRAERRLHVDHCVGTTCWCRKASLMKQIAVTIQRAGRISPN